MPRIPPTSDSAPPSERRPYRPAAERRAEILDAARREFTRSGYAGAKTREIAAAADVSEARLFRLFSSKDQLFEEAVAAPLEEAVTNAFRPAPGDAGVREVSQSFVADLLEAMHEIVPLLTTVLADEDRGLRFYRDRFEPALARLRDSIDANLSEWDHRDFDPELAMRAVCGMCMFIALDSRFGTGAPPDTKDIAPELLAIVWDGLRSRPSDGQ